MWNAADKIIGYIEAKKPSQEDLDGIEDSEQLKRYRATFPNLILTNAPLTIGQRERRRWGSVRMTENTRTTLKRRHKAGPRPAGASFCAAQRP